MTDRFEALENIGRMGRWTMERKTWGRRRLDLGRALRMSVRHEFAHGIARMKMKISVHYVFRNRIVIRILKNPFDVAAR